MPQSKHLLYSSVPQPSREVSDLDRALAAQVPVTSNKGSKHRPMGAEEFQTLHDGDLEEANRRALMATSGIPRGVQDGVQVILSHPQGELF